MSIKPAHHFAGPMKVKRAPVIRRAGLLIDILCLLGIVSVRAAGVARRAARIARQLV